MRVEFGAEREIVFGWEREDEMGYLESSVYAKPSVISGPLGSGSFVV
jgi:hypothetical protein